VRKSVLGNGWAAQKAWPDAHEIVLQGLLIGVVLRQRKDEGRFVFGRLGPKGDAPAPGLKAQGVAEVEGCEVATADR
jgi:hypothetical protein